MADAAVTTPTAPRLKLTVLLAAVVLKPKPAMVMVFWVAVRLVVLAVIAGTTVATEVAEPLLTLLVDTWAVKLPTALGLTTKVTVKLVRVAALTVPVTPPLKVTVLRDGVVSKPNPLIVTEVALYARFAVLLVMTGTTFAT